MSDLLHLELLLEDYLEQIRTAAQTPASVQMDTAELLEVMRTLPSGPTPEEIARAIAKVISIPKPTDMTPLLVEMMGALQQTAQELKGIGKKLKALGMPIVTGPVALDGGQFEVTNFPATTEIANDSGNPIPVSGSVSIGNFPATQETREAQPTTATVTSVPGSVTSVTLLASNTNRRQAMIHNDSTTSVLFVKFGAGAAATSFTTRLPAGSFFELPWPIYTGLISGVWDVATGNARITELV